MITSFSKAKHKRSILKNIKISDVKNNKGLAFVFLLPVLLLFCSRKNVSTPTPPAQESVVIEKRNEPSTTTNENRPVIKKIPPKRLDERIEDLEINSVWVDSVFKSLSPEERIGQLIMFDAYSYMPKAHLDTLMNLVKNYKIGGLIFFKGGPGRQINMINKLQSVSKVPLLIAMDAENGIGMRLDSTNKYPFQMTLGAISDNTLIYEMGKAIAYDVKRVGMHVNFAPVLDINSNPANPVIGIRSFGESKKMVTAKSLAYMKGLQDHGVLATAKHFPGHGDTHIDSHRDLPLIDASRERLDTLELYPFKELIKEGLGGVMIAHMNIPALDQTDKLPSTLSKKIVTDLLRKDLGFKGLVFTDAMVMEGVAKYYPSGVAEPMAVIAGNDILEKMKNARVAVKSIKAAVDRGDIKQEEIDKKCRKILAVKEWVGLNTYQPTSLQNLSSDLRNQKTEALMTELIESAATLLINKENAIPVTSNTNNKIATLSLNASEFTLFQRKISKNLNTENFILPLKASANSINKVTEDLKKFDLVIVNIYDNRNWPMYKLNYSSQLIEFINKLVSSKKTIVTLFANPYALGGINSIHKANGLLVMYENSAYTQNVAADIILGIIPPKGKLPVTVDGRFKFGDGIWGR